MNMLAFEKSAPLRRVGTGERWTLAILAVSFLVPAFSSSPALISLFSQIMIGIMGALSVYIMMRMNLMTFAVPAFMAIGGYAAAIASLRYGVTGVVPLAVISFFVPLIIALPLGVMVLRLRGVYFVLVTFIMAEIMPLLLFETPSLTGGANGLSGLPIISIAGYELESNRDILYLCTGLALLACALTVALTTRYREHFAAIEENEVLAQSLGLVIWKYKVIGFCVAAGLGGLGGFALVNMLLTAHPSSFEALSSVNYIAYTIVGGSSSILGPIVGSALLVWAADLFSFQGEYSAGLLGLLLMVVILGMKGGIVGTLQRLFRRPAKPQAPAVGAKRVPVKTTEGELS